MLKHIFRILLPLLLLSLCFGAAYAEAVPPKLSIREPAPVLPSPREPMADEAGLAAAAASDFIVDANGLITAYQGTDSVLSIPAEIGGVRITGIAYGAFRDNLRLTEVILPEGLNTVGYLAFSGCANLRSVTLPDSLATIDGWAFQGCASLKEIDIPENVVSIGECAFYQCASLTDVTLSDGLLTLGDWVFSACTSLKQLSLPDSVVSVGEYAFFNCDALESLRLSDKIASIGELFAGNCIHLKSVNIPASAKTIGEYAFYGCRPLTGLVLPEGLTAIDDYAFYGCAGLTTVSIPSTAKHIGEMAFYGCDGITAITLPDGLELLEEGSLPPNAVVTFGTSSLIEEYVLSHGMKFVCDGKDTTADTADTVEEKIEWILENYLTDGMNEYEKALRLYNWLCANVAYDYQWLETGVSTTEYGVTVEGALLGGWAVCEGYAEAYMQLLDEAGIEARYVSGYAGNGSHGWNLARIDGKWYQFDPTWDEAGNGSTHIYFGLTDYAMRSNHTQNEYKNIVCSSYDANYEYRTGEYDELLDMLCDGISESISRGEYSGMIDVSDASQPAYFWDGPSPYTVAFILNQSDEWPMVGHVEVTPSDPGFRFTFQPDTTIVTDLQVSGMKESSGYGRYLMAPGETAQLTVVTTPAGAPVRFSSSNSSVLSVASDGLVTAIAEGSATLTITSNNYSREFDVTVSGLNVVFKQAVYEGRVNDRINPDVFITGDPEGEYQDHYRYLRVEITGGNAVTYIGYYPPKLDEAMNSWNYWFAADCMETGAVTIIAKLENDEGVSGSCRIIVYDDNPWTLPDAVREISAEAFSGVNAEEIILPDGIESIGEKAFSGCTDLELVHMPASLTDIADSAFDGCRDVTLLCKPGTPAEAYAIENNLDYITLP